MARPGQAELNKSLTATADVAWLRTATELFVVVSTILLPWLQWMDKFYWFVFEHIPCCNAIPPLPIGNRSHKALCNA